MRDQALDEIQADFTLVEFDIVVLGTSAAAIVPKFFDFATGAASGAREAGF